MLSIFYEWVGGPIRERRKFVRRRMGPVEQGKGGWGDGWRGKLGGSGGKLVGGGQGWSE